MEQESILHLLGIASVVVIVVGLLPYYADILQGNTKPQRAAMLIFAVLSAIAFLGQLAEGAQASLWFAAALLANQLILLGLSIKYGMGGFSRFDKISLLLASLILVGWYFTNSAALALILVTVVNTVAKILVMTKVYSYPYSELLFAWIMSTAASILAALSVGRLDLILLLVPVQNAVTVGIIAGIIIVRKRQLPAPTRT